MKHHDIEFPFLIKGQIHVETDTHELGSAPHTVHREGWMLQGGDAGVYAQGRHPPARERIPLLQTPTLYLGSFSAEQVFMLVNHILKYLGST